jgi:hypothetical protein
MQTDCTNESNHQQSFFASAGYPSNRVEQNCSVIMTTKTYFSDAYQKLLIRDLLGLEATSVALAV